LSYFQDYNSQPLTCSNDNDCPIYSKCKKSPKEPTSICEFGSFYCPEELNSVFYSNGKSEAYCVYINPEIYDLENNKSNINGTKPILNACPPYSNGCITPKCEKDTDCLLGICSDDNQCITSFSKIFYRCSGDDSNNNTDNYVKCKKADYIRCDNGFECYSGQCNLYNGYKSDNNNQHKYCYPSYFKTKKSFT